MENPQGFSERESEGRSRAHRAVSQYPMYEEERKVSHRASPLGAALFMP